MAGVRMTGLVSGLDTESIVQQLGEAYQLKVDNAKKAQTKLEWKKEAWGTLNTKIMDFYKGALSDFKSVSTYRKKGVTGDLSGVKITAGNSAVNGTHKVYVKQTANAQMWTGKKIYARDEDGNPTSSVATGSTKLKDLGIAAGSEIKINDNTITIDENTTLSSLATQMSKLGIDANYDAGQGRFYLNAKATGTDNAFTVGGATAVLSALGLDLAVGDEGRIDASNAIVNYNGVDYEQATGSFSINGLTIEAIEESEYTTNSDGTKNYKAQTFTVDTDTQAIYDKVKAFVKSYNTLISEMNTLYDAERVTDYEPLTDEEKEAMSDDEIEKWESKIKGSLLRRDSTISSLLSSMRSILNGQVSVTQADGSTKKYSLSSFGINTGLYQEKGQLHIYGDSEDSDYADYDDKLMAAIMENPNAVEETFSQLGQQIYDKLYKAMGSSDLSSALTFYNDKQMDSEIEEYKDKVSTLQEKAIAAEDKYYAQFSAMESALAKLQSQQTYISQLFGS